MVSPFGLGTSCIFFLFPYICDLLVGCPFVASIQLWFTEAHFLFSSSCFLEEALSRMGYDGYNKVCKLSDTAQVIRTLTEAGVQVYYMVQGRDALVRVCLILSLFSCSKQPSELSLTLAQLQLLSVHIFLQAMSPAFIRGVCHAVVTETGPGQPVAVGLAYNLMTTYPAAYACVKRWSIDDDKNFERGNTGKNTGNIIRVRTLFKQCKLFLFFFFFFYLLHFLLFGLCAHRLTVE